MLERYQKEIVDTVEKVIARVKSQPDEIRGSYLDALLIHFMKENIENLNKYFTHNYQLAFKIIQNNCEVIDTNNNYILFSTDPYVQININNIKKINLINPSASEIKHLIEHYITHISKTKKNDSSTKEFSRNKIKAYIRDCLQIVNNDPDLERAKNLIAFSLGYSTFDNLNAILRKHFSLKLEKLPLIENKKKIKIIKLIDLTPSSIAIEDVTYRQMVYGAFRRKSTITPLTNNDIPVNDSSYCQNLKQQIPSSLNWITVYPQPMVEQKNNKRKNETDNNFPANQDAQKNAPTSFELLELDNITLQNVDASSNTFLPSIQPPPKRQKNLYYYLNENNEKIKVDQQTIVEDNGNSFIYLKSKKEVLPEETVLMLLGLESMPIKQANRSHQEYYFLNNDNQFELIEDQSFIVYDSGKLYIFVQETVAVFQDKASPAPVNTPFGFFNNDAYFNESVTSENLNQDDVLHHIKRNN